MSRTYLRQDTQIRNSDAYDDTLASGAALEVAVNGGSIEQDLNALRSQVKRILGQINWYDNLAGRSLADTDGDLDAFETRTILCPVQILQNVTVPNGQNFVLLDVASNEAPTYPAGVAGGLGTVVAVLGAAEIETHMLTAVAGSNALRPLNLVVVRDAVTKDVLTSGGQQVFGLLQAEEGVVQDDTFNDVDKRVQISFVRANGDVLEAVPVADVEDRVVEYMYARRIYLKDIPEDCSFPNIKFVDNVALNGGKVRGTKVYAEVTANLAANVDVGGVGGGTNLDAQLPDMSVGTFLQDYDVYLNGSLLRPGANAAANHDYYPGTSLANGQLRFEFALKSGDVLCVVPHFSL